VRVSFYKINVIWCIIYEYIPYYNHMKKSATSTTLKLSSRKLLLIFASTLAFMNTTNINAQQDTSRAKFNLSKISNIEEFAKIVEQYTGKIIIVDNKVKNIGNISFSTEKAVSKEQMLQILSAGLRTYGVAMVEDNNYIRIVQEADAKLLGGKVLSDNDRSNENEKLNGNLRLSFNGKKNRVISRGINKSINNGQIVTQIFNLQYETAANIYNVLRPLISSNNVITATPSSNSIVITDYADNLQRLSKIIATLDKPSNANINISGNNTNKDFDSIQLKNAIASDVGAMASKLFDLGNNDVTFKVNILVDGRTNSIILYSNNAARLKLIRQFILSSDMPSGQNNNLWIVSLKNADANSVAQTLRAVISASSSGSNAVVNSSSGGSASSITPTASASTNSSGASTGMNSSFSATASNSLGGQVQADVATNSLIISASEPVYKGLRHIIDKLDTQRAQVFVESMIVEISSQKAEELGIQWQALLGGGGDRLYINSASGISSSGSIPQVSTGASSILGIGGTSANAASLSALGGVNNGFNIGWLHKFGATFGLSALAKAISNQSGVNILSTPNLLTLDNEEAKIIIGQNVPFITGQYTNSNNSNSSGVNPFQTIERNDVGLTLRVKPQVSANGKVKLKIYQEVSNVDDKSNASGIITNKRSIDTTVEVKSGEPIVLGGLLEDTYGDSAEKVPGLSKVPFIGGLFRYEKKSRGKKNLMLFLRPYVVYDNAKEITTSRYDYIQEKEYNYSTVNNAGVTAVNVKNSLITEKDYPLLDLNKLNFANSNKYIKTNIKQNYTNSLRLDTNLSIK
jgi:general secretion pathway protein D